MEEGVEVGRLRGLGSRFLEVVLAGLRSRSKVVGLSSFAGWWGRTVTIGIGPFERGSR